jgi:hypothetical protein
VFGSSTAGELFLYFVDVSFEIRSDGFFSVRIETPGHAGLDSRVAKSMCQTVRNLRSIWSDPVVHAGGARIDEQKSLGEIGRNF